MENRRRLVIMVEIALLVAFSMVIDFVDSGLKMGPYSFSFSMVPVLILALRRGVVPGMIGGLLWAILQLVLGDASGSIVHPAQGFLDYPIAFSMLGLAGLAKNRLTAGSILLFVTLAIVCRYFFHFISGLVFFGSYAPKGQPAWIYSLIVNGTTMIPNLIMCLAIILLLYSFAKRIFIPNA